MLCQSCALPPPAGNELQAAQAEVERLSRLIFSFQQAVSAVLPFQ